MLQGKSRAAIVRELQRTVWKTLGTIFLNAVYSRQGLTRTIGLINILIDGGQPRAKPHLRRAKPHHI